MAKKKTEKQIQITPQMQDEFNRYSQVFGDVAPSTMTPQTGYQKMSMDELTSFYNNATNQNTNSYSKLPTSELDRIYNEAKNSAPQNNTIPTLDDLISNPTLKSKEDTYKTDYSQAISDLQNALNGNDLSDGQRNAYNEFLGGLNTLQGEINAHNNKVAKTSQIRSQTPISKKEEQKKEKQISTYDKENPMSYRDREIAKSVKATSKGKVDTSYRDREIANSVKATQKYNDSLKARGYSLEPKEEEIQNPTFLGYQPSAMQFGELKKSTTPTPASTAIPQVNLEQLANNKAKRDAIAEDREKIKADRAIRVAEGDYSEAISHFNDLANKEDLTKDEKKEINDEFKRLGEKYGVGRTSDIAINRYREALKNGEISEEYANAVSNAHYRNSLEGKTAIGIANMGATLTRPLTTLAGLVDPNLRETNAEVQNQLDEWNEVAPVASTIGDMAGMLGLYSGVNIAPETIKNVGARLAINQGIDNVLDVIPRLKTNYDAGKYNNADGTLNEKALLTDIALQEGMSAVGNGIGEGINAISNRLAKNRAIRNFDVDDILENSTPEELGLDITIPRVNDVADDATPQTYLDGLKSQFDNAKPVEKAQMLVDGGYYPDMQVAGKAYKNGELDNAVEDYLSIMERNGNPTSTKPTTDYLNLSQEEVNASGGWNEARLNRIKEFTNSDDAKAKEYLDALSTFTRGTSSELSGTTQILDEYVRNAPTYEGQISRGLHFNLGTGEYDNFMNNVHNSNGVVTLGRPSSWSADQEVSRRFAHLNDDAVDSVQIISNQNRTSTPIGFANGQGENEILSSSDATWTVIKEDTQTMPNGARKTVLYVAETGDNPNGATIIPDSNLSSDGIHTESQLRTIDEYANAGNERVYTWLKRTANKEKSMKYMEVSKENPQVAEYVKDKLGIDISDNAIGFSRENSFRHIQNEHMNLSSNKSQITDDDLSKIGYVVSNPDEVVITGKTTSAHKTKDNSPAPKIMLRKRIDGHYYVVEAVTDAETKQDIIVTAFIEKVGNETDDLKKLFSNAYRVDNALPKTDSPFPNVLNGHENNIGENFDNSLTDNIPNKNDTVNFENTEIPTVDAVKEELTNTSIPKVENEIKNYNGDVGTPKDMPQYERGKVSKTRTNTLENSGINTKEELESEYLDPNKFKYEDETESMQMERAISDIINDPKGEYEKVMSKTMDSGSEDDVNKLFIFYNEAVKVARESDNPEAWKEASKIYKQIQELGTDRSKGLQAFAKFSRNTKEGIMAQGLRDIRSELEKEMGNSVAKETVDKILDNELKNLDELLSKAMDVGFESREGKKILAQFGKICDKYTPKTYRGKLQTILMDNMLGNFRTLISRNAGGNVGYNALEFARQPITALYDKALSKKTGARTRTGWSRDKIASSLNGFKNGFLDEIDDVRSGLHTAKDGESTLPKAIDLNRHTWSENHASNGSVVYNKLGLNKNESVNKFMDASGKVANKIDDLVKHGLSMGDRPFYEAAYNQRLSELTDLRSRGLLSDDLMSLSDEEFNVIAELSAKMDGLSATYQDDSAIAEALSLFKEGLGKVSEEFTGFNWLAQLSTPFVKTPGNIIDKAIDYSPLGFVKRYGEVISDKVRGRDFNQQRFVDEAGRNILGTGLVGGGYALARNGIVNGAYDEDADVKNAQKNSGMIEYGLNLPNNYNMDMSWIPVLGTDAIIGSAINDSLKNNPDATFGEAVGNGATAMLNTLLDQSSTQGLQRVFGGTNSYGSSGWGDNIKSTIESGLGQFVPSLSRQIANSTDKYQREISDGDRTYEINNILSGIPIAREANLQPKVDNEGNLVLQNQGRGLGSRLAENMLFPGTLKQVEQSPLDEEAMRIYNADETKGEKKQFVTTPKRNDIATDDYVPTDEDYRRYKEDVGTKKRELGNLLLNNPDYQKLTDVQKSEILSSLYSQSKMASELTFKPGYTTNEKNVKAIAEGRYDDAISKLIDSQTVSKAIQNKEEDMSEADGALSYLKKEDKTEEEKGKILYNNLKSNKTTVGLVENGESYEAKDGKSYSGYEGVYHFYNDKSELDENGEISEETQQKKALVEELNDLGVKGTSADKLYNHAKEKIPSLTTEQFATTFNKINTDGNTSIKQDEMFAYFKKNHLTEKQASDLWKAYGDWKTIPYLKEDGTWGKH